ncbi:MAG TPA: amino acid permease [Terriglobales bacterium]|nr:amino acid permease [Terriglobales bacterium]
MPDAGAARAHLARDLSIRHAAALVVGIIIGSGIFLVPKEMMQAVGSVEIVLLAWLTGGVLSFFGAVTYAELGAMRPSAGGEYVYIRDAYGPLLGFLYAWATFTISKPASIATVSSGFVRVLGNFPALHFLSHELLSVPIFSERMVITWGHFLAVTVIILLTALNWIGVRRAGEFQVVFTILKVAMIVGIAAVCFTLTGGQWENFSSHYPEAKGGIAGFMIALIAALWAYDGWNNLPMVASEIRQPERTIPLALIAGIFAVAFLYILMYAAVQYVMPAEAVAAAERPASLATQMVAGPFGAGLVTAGMALSMFVTMNGQILAGARIPFAAAQDGYFFPRLATVHPRYHTPTMALLFQSGLTILLILVGGSFQQLFSLAIFAEWIFYMIAAGSIFVFRRREPDAPRAYRAWGYPIVPGLFIAASAVLLYYSFTENLRNSMWGSLVILAGVPVFYFFARKPGR